MRTEYKQQVLLLNASSQGSNSVVASLVSRYNTLRETRDYANNDAMAAVNTAVADAQGGLNNASLSQTAFSDYAAEQTGEVGGRLGTNQRILTGAVEQVNGAVRAGNATLDRSAKSITDLADEINSKLTLNIAAMNSNALTLRNSVWTMLSELDDSFFSLEDSVQRLRNIINADISKYDEVGPQPCLILSRLSIHAWH